MVMCLHSRFGRWHYKTREVGGKGRERNGVRGERRMPRLVSFRGALKDCVPP